MPCVHIDQTMIRRRSSELEVMWNVHSFAAATEKSPAAIAPFTLSPGWASEADDTFSSGGLRKSLVNGGAPPRGVTPAGSSLDLHISSANSEVIHRASHARSFGLFSLNTVYK